MSFEASDYYLIIRLNVCYYVRIEIFNMDGSKTIGRKMCREITLQK